MPEPDSRPAAANAETPHVFAVIPVFNRWHHTEACLAALRRQTHAALTAIVSDGGSTDGTRERVAREHPGVVLVHDDAEPRWWAGSTALGIDEARRRGAAGDYVLLLNNDTLIPDDFVGTLLACSAAENAAVGAPVVDSRDRSVVLDAGEFVDWQNYDFPVRSHIPAGATFLGDVDVLPGRGTLVPLRMIATVGNVDDHAFPHYLADYDFFRRLAEAGFRLGLCCRTWVAAHIEETGIRPSAARTSVAAAWRELTSRRSMTNVRDHWRFIARHAPAADRPRLHRLLLRRAAVRLILHTPLRYPAMPFIFAVRAGRFMRRMRRVAVAVWTRSDRVFAALELGRPWRGVALVLLLPRPFERGDRAITGLDLDALLARGVARPLIPGWFGFTTLGNGEPQAVRRAISALSWPGPAKLAALRRFRRELHRSPPGG